jgi:hypothetical protein
MMFGPSLDRPEVSEFSVQLLSGSHRWQDRNPPPALQEAECPDEPY